MIERRNQVRIFVGIKIDGRIGRELSRYAEQVRDLPVKRIPLVDIHVTLLPPWMTEDIPAVLDQLRGVVRDREQFTLELRRVRYGPSLDQPRFLWAECAATPQIVDLKRGLLDAFQLREEAPFRPHATIARLPENNPALVREYPIDAEISLVQDVNSIELFQSPHGGGFGYTMIESIPLLSAETRSQRG